MERAVRLSLKELQKMFFNSEQNIIRRKYGILGMKKNRNGTYLIKYNT